MSVLEGQSRVGTGKEQIAVHSWTGLSLASQDSWAQHEKKAFTFDFQDNILKYKTKRIWDNVHAFLSNTLYGSWGHWIKNHKNYLLNKDSQAPREPMEKELAQSMDKSKTDGSRKQLESAQASQALASHKLNHTNFYFHHASCTITSINCPRFLMKWVGGRWDYRSNRIQTRICDFQGDFLLERKAQHKLAEQNEKEKTLYSTMCEVVCVHSVGLYLVTPSGSGRIW